MSSPLVALVSIASIATFMVVAQVSRIRGLARRGETLARSRGFERVVELSLQRLELEVFAVAHTPSLSIATASLSAFTARW